MNSREIKIKIIEQAESMARSIEKGKDIEIIKTSSGISIKEISKKKLA